MEAILLEVASESALAAVSMFAIYRMSVVMISLAQSLTKIAESITSTIQSQTETITEHKPEQTKL